MRSPLFNVTVRARRNNHPKQTKTPFTGSVIVSNSVSFLLFEYYFHCVFSVQTVILVVSCVCERLKKIAKLNWGPYTKKTPARISPRTHTHIWIYLFIVRNCILLRPWCAHNNLVCVCVSSFLTYKDFKSFNQIVFVFYRCSQI